MLMMVEEVGAEAPAGEDSQSPAVHLVADSAGPLIGVAFAGANVLAAVSQAAAVVQASAAARVNVAVEVIVAVWVVVAAPVIVAV